MKKYLLYLGIVLSILCNYNITKSLDCCNYISVTSEVTDSCCIKIHVINPQCSGAVVTLEIKNGSFGQKYIKILLRKIQLSHIAHQMEVA